MKAAILTAYTVMFITFGFFIGVMLVTTSTITILPLAMLVIKTYVVLGAFMGAIVAAIRTQMILI